MGSTLSGLSSEAQSLLLATRSGDALGVAEVLKARPTLIQATFDGNYNAMHHAAVLGHTEVLKAMISALRPRTMVTSNDMYTRSGGAQELQLGVLKLEKIAKHVLNAQTSGGRTPLLLACQNGHKFCASFLLEQGASPYAVDGRAERNALHIAAMGGHSCILEMLINHDVKATILRRRVGTRYIDGQAANGETALHMATAVGNTACIEVLLAAGASMAVQTTSPMTATSHLLGMSGAIIFLQGSTSLHIAAQCNRTAIIRLLLKANEDSLHELQLPHYVNSWRPLNTPSSLDVRKITDDCNQLAHHLAWQGSFCYASILLDPRISIENVLQLDCSFLDGHGPGTLAGMTLSAVRLSMINWLEDFCRENARSKVRDLTLGGQANCSLKASVAKGEEPVLRPTPKSPSMLILAAQGSDDSESECGICLNATANIGFDSCRHSLCAECSIWLCNTSQELPLCPFCRTAIGAFHCVAF